MSAVWKYFTVKGEKSQAECNVCNVSVLRGGKAGNYNTTNLIKHLHKHHLKQYEEFMQTTSAKKKSVPLQQTLQEVIQKLQKLTPESNKAKLITEKVTEFIVLDDQPLSVVENMGFQRLCRYYISDTAVPSKYKQVCEFISKRLENVSTISFTTDIWSSDVCPMSLLSLTAQWIYSSFDLQKAVLHAKQFRGSHTGESIAGATEKMLNTWKIAKSKVHVVLRDNASNMIKAMNHLGVPSLGCFAHTLQLIVNEGLLSQRSIPNREQRRTTLAVSRKIVGHFKHSPLAYSRLEDIQLELNMQPRRLQQDVRTRWNSTLYMIESLIAQKRTLCAYTAEYDLPYTLTANQWGLLEKTITVLAPFEELTREVSSSFAFASDVIPSVIVLKRILTRQTETDEGIKSMKGTLLEAVNRRFRDVESEPLYSLATLLDPRYKDRYFTNEEISRHTKDALMSLTQASKMEEVLGRTISDASQPADGTSSELAASEPAKKTSRVEAASKNRLGNIFNEILEESTVECVPPQSTTTNARIEIQTYLIEPTIQRSDSPLLYWKVNKPRLPCLAATATKFLSAPSTSVESERLFSSASIIVDERRSSLSAEKAEMLIFLKKNLPIMLK
ncbi:putative zinc finger BED domain-containing protein 4-like [Triplophysa rosa]|uniref:Zinc finger BED domain-containing protein 4-like n=1 Tax=Triplophysa rosa TaxID=992332 RepID=A0A9W7T6A7_TRIRA|nr:putative zinc finger BED domain-containing protein 4-like [Triplophysa rosa]